MIQTIYLVRGNDRVRVNADEAAEWLQKLGEGWAVEQAQPAQKPAAKAKAKG